MTENIMLQETNLCEICSDKIAELVCKECKRSICHFCNAGEDDAPVCDDCDDENCWDMEDDTEPRPEGRVEPVLPHGAPLTLTTNH